MPRVCASILRQDPDIVMIGEIRDEETAEIAVPRLDHRASGFSPPFITNDAQAPLRDL